MVQWRSCLGEAASEQVLKEEKHLRRITARMRRNEYTEKVSLDVVTHKEGKPASNSVYVFLLIIIPFAQ